MPVFKKLRMLETFKIGTVASVAVFVSTTDSNPVTLDGKILFQR